METITQTVACEVCLQDIPTSEDTSVEARDYVAYFCGLDCYAEWHGQTKQLQAEAKFETPN